MQAFDGDPPPFSLANLIKRQLRVVGTRFWTMIPSSTTEGKENCTIFTVQGHRHIGEVEEVECQAEGQVDDRGQPRCFWMMKADIEGGALAFVHTALHLKLNSCVRHKTYVIHRCP